MSTAERIGDSKYLTSIFCIILHFIKQHIFLASYIPVTVQKCIPKHSFDFWIKGPKRRHAKINMSIPTTRWIQMA